MQKTKLKRGCLQITYRNLSLAISKPVALTVAFCFAIFFVFAVVTIQTSSNAGRQIEELKSQIVFQKNVNESLTQTIKKYHTNIEEIANQLSGKEKSKNDTNIVKIESKLQLYGIVKQIQQNLEVINDVLDSKIKKISKMIQMTALIHSPSITSGLERLNIAKSIPANQPSASIQKASNSVGVHFTNNISSIAQKVLLKKEGIDTIIQTISQIPLKKPIAEGRLASGFGLRFHPIHKSHKMHNGIDFVGKKGAEVLATADGIIERAVYSPSYGNFVVIRHKNNIKTLYAHMSKLNVLRGQRVRSGQQIGIQGNTGSSTGEHIHYEIIVSNRHQNPMNFLKVQNILQETL